MKKILITVALMGSAGLTQPALAQTAQPATTPAPVKTAKPAPAKVTLTQDQIKTVTADGKATETVLPNPKTVLPGDVLREEATVTSLVAVPVKGMAIKIPVPLGTTYAGQPTPTNTRWKTEYSIDKGKTFAVLPMKTVTTTENGKSVSKQVAAATNEYTNVRWIILELSPREALKFSFRVRVN